jgi:hypothetical protein
VVVNPLNDDLAMANIHGVDVSPNRRTHELQSVPGISVFSHSQVSLLAFSWDTSFGRSPVG